MSSTTESSTDDSEENTGFCCMHTISTHSKVISFSGKSYRKFKECVDLWKNVSFGFELEKKVAANAVNLNFDSFEQQTEQDSSGASGGGVYHGGVRTATSSTKKRCVQPGYHAGCYRHFCNITTIKRAQIKAKKKQGTLHI
ncbi:uncharacterized protein LOC115928357 [Strongylocentrotus purpuratus]|uniref:Uncharacterized protein n=1 Tax=Strongylocentrotus purpuratus TaxID=7668 RepID=A0A7M7PHZ8_STRPU|nr:uncharacterized protein LOC115928357 [Strongylocentrotus purpuratus]